MKPELQLPRLGIEEIDRQHQVLLDCIVRLEHWIGKGHGFPAAMDAVAALQQYVAEHFRYEEEFLRSHDYPDLEAHIAQHREITAKVDTFSRTILDGGDITRELLSFLRYWIVGHIGEDDVAFASFFKGKPR